MSEYRTAWEILLERRNRGHLLIGDDDEYGRPRPVKADHDRIRALEKALWDIAMHEAHGEDPGVLHDTIDSMCAVALCALQRPDDHRQPRQDDRPDGRADG